MIKMIRWSLAATFIGGLSTPALAQGTCSDILQNGVFNSIDVNSRSEYREIIVSRFISSSYASSKNSSSGINGKSIGEIVMGGAYTESDYNLKKAVLQQSYDRTLTKLDEWNMAVRTADPTIVSEWGRCMASQSGLLARFETQPGDGQNITLVVTMKGAVGVNQIAVAGDTTIPAGVQIISQNQYNRCLKDGAIIKNGVDCRVALTAPSSKPVKLIVSSDNGDAEAYIAKRLRWEYDAKSFIYQDEKTLKPNSGSFPSEVISISAENIDAGYTFKPGTMIFSGPTRTYGSGDAKCDQFSHKPSATSTTYTYRMTSTDNTSTKCKLIMQAVIERDRFVPDE